MNAEFFDPWGIHKIRGLGVKFGVECSVLVVPVNYGNLGWNVLSWLFLLIMGRCILVTENWGPIYEDLPLLLKLIL